MRARHFLTLAGALAGLVFGASSARAATPCEQLAKLALPKATITLAQSVGAEQYQPAMNPHAPNGRDITGRT